MKTHYHAKKIFISFLRFKKKKFFEENAHAQKLWNTFEINNRGEYHDLHVQSDTLLLADVFENFRNMS